jgi:hypothetical protein
MKANMSEVVLFKTSFEGLLVILLVYSVPLLPLVQVSNSPETLTTQRVFVD